MEQPLEEPAVTLEFDWRRPRSFLDVALAAITAPREFFAQMPKEGGLLPALLFLLAAHLPPALVAGALSITTGLGPALLMIIKTLAMPIAMGLSFAVLLFAVVQFLARGNRLTLPQTVRVVCYSSGIQALSFLPWLLSAWAMVLASLVMMLLILYLIVKGIQTVGGLGGAQAWGSMGLAFLITVLVAGWLGVAKVAEPPAAPPDAPVPGAAAPRDK